MQTQSTVTVTEDVENVGEKKASTASEKSVSGRETPVQSTLAAQGPVTVSEGGLHGWLTLIGVCLFQYCTFGYVGTFGVYQDYYVRIYLTNYTPDKIGWIGGTQIFLLFSLGALSGRLFDRGYFKSLLFAIFTLSVSHQNKYYQVFLSHGLCFGLSVDCVLSHYFRRRLTHRCIHSGAVVHPIMLNQLINGSVGFHNGVRISAALNVFLLIIASFIMRPGLPPAAPGTIKNPIGVLMCCGIFFPLFFIQLDAITHGVDERLAFYAISILNAASIFGRTLPGLLTPITALCMAAVKDATGTILFAIFYGLFSGGAIALPPAMIAMISKDVNEVGTRIGFYFFFGGFLALFAIPIAGALLTDEYHWLRAILFAGFMLWGAGIFYSLSDTYLLGDKL
ncbi:hypothetical protein BDQ17DRAFT_1344765 [Cyathus striatus]|nr:hypothetical protein BDQ17DRAFT_1344765 [Cyathus striatus]